MQLLSVLVVISPPHARLLSRLLHLLSGFLEAPLLVQSRYPSQCSQIKFIIIKNYIIHVSHRLFLHPSFLIANAHLNKSHI